MTTFINYCNNIQFIDYCENGQLETALRGFIREHHGLARECAEVISREMA